MALLYNGSATFSCNCRTRYISLHRLRAISDYSKIKVGRAHCCQAECWLIYYSFFSSFIVHTLKIQFKFLLDYVWFCPAVYNFNSNELR